jgi:hypothetical protein
MSVIADSDGREAVVMDSRTGDRVRHDLDELVDAGLDVAAFCAAAGPLVARAVPSATGAAATPTWYPSTRGRC